MGIIVVIIIVAVFIYCCFVIPLGKQTGDRYMAGLYDESGLNKYLRTRDSIDIKGVSRSVASAAANKEEEYVWKYFFKDKTDETILNYLDSLNKNLDDYNGSLDEAYRKALSLVNTYKTECENKMIYKFPLAKIGLPSWSIPKPLHKNHYFKFHYISPQGRSSLTTTVKFDIHLSNYIEQQVINRNGSKH